MGSISEFGGNEDKTIRKIQVLSYWEKGPFFKDNEWKFGDTSDESRLLPNTAVGIDRSTGEKLTFNVKWVLPHKLAKDTDPSESSEKTDYHNTVTKMNWKI